MSHLVTMLSAALLSTEVRAIPRVEVVAHRGYSAIAPENTLSASAGAIRAGADYVECDVRRSKDGCLVVMHDGSVERTTDGAGRVEDLTLEQLKSLDAGSWFHPAFAGERIPTLDELLWLAKGKIRVIIEVKQPGIEDDVVADVRGAGMFDDVIVISFDDSVGLRVGTIAPEFRYMMLRGIGAPVTSDEARALVESVKSVHACGLDVDYESITPALVDALHESGLKLNAWTVDSARDIMTLAGMGVDIITTNQPSMALDIMGRR